MKIENCIIGQLVEAKRDIKSLRSTVVHEGTVGIIIQDNNECPYVSWQPGTKEVHPDMYSITFDGEEWDNIWAVELKDLRLLYKPVARQFPRPMASRTAT